MQLAGDGLTLTVWQELKGAEVVVDEGRTYLVPDKADMPFSARARVAIVSNQTCDGLIVTLPHAVVKKVVVTDLEDWRVYTRSAVAVGNSVFLTTDAPLRLSLAPSGVLAQAPAVRVLTKL